MIDVIKKSKILICGGSSLLSYMWCNALSGEYEIYLTNNITKTKYLDFPVIRVNMLSVNSIVKVISSYSIDIVVNTIGLTNVDECQNKPEEAYLLNSHLAGYVAKACNIANKKLIHISTDHLFRDEKVKHTENDEVSLVNVYAKSKFNGELEVLNNMPSALICRTNFFGKGPPHKLSFSDWIINSLNKNKIITLHNDVYYTPISGNNLVYFALKLLDFNCSGIFNICSNEVITKHEFGMLLCKTLNISSEYINSGPISSRFELTLRPTSMALSNDKLVSKLKLSMPPLVDQIQTLDI